jgi:hypothetical protein
MAQQHPLIGAFAAAFGGVDTLVFAGGIGENAPLIRERICDGLGFLGFERDSQRSAKTAPLISSDIGRVKVRGIRAAEELRSRGPLPESLICAHSPFRWRRTPAWLEAALSVMRLVVLSPSGIALSQSSIEKTL